MSFSNESQGEQEIASILSHLNPRRSIGISALTPNYLETNENLDYSYHTIHIQSGLPSRNPTKEYEINLHSGLPSRIPTKEYEKCDSSGTCLRCTVF